MDFPSKKAAINSICNRAF